MDEAHLQAHPQRDLDSEDEVSLWSLFLLTVWLAGAVVLIITKQRWRYILWPILSVHALISELASWRW
jgi:hypothetical protein